ncbi:phage repressor protein [Klebsiella aerogenes]|uniref:phage repressor protein n=1 Tax=Klebsiella aerogenes TaxID=548 RepID=UPI0021D0211C|nr:phage repressor protein [Klebsiella aerogenes]
METGVSIDWLVSGKGELKANFKNTLIDIEIHEIKNGETMEHGTYKIDDVLLPKKIKSPLAIMVNKHVYICEREDTAISDGQWLVVIEGKLSIKKINPIQIKKIMVTRDDFSFGCDVNDIKLIAKVYNIICEV